MGRAIVLLHRETDGRPPPPVYTTTSTGVLFPFAGELNPRIRDGKGRVRGRTPAALWCSRASESRYSTSSGALNGGGTAAPAMGGASTGGSSTGAGGAGCTTIGWVGCVTGASGVSWPPGAGFGVTVTGSVGPVSPPSATGTGTRTMAPDPAASGTAPDLS